MRMTTTRPRPLFSRSPAPLLTARATRGGYQGLEFQESGPLLISDMIKEAMNGMDVSVLMGANVANEGARDGTR